MHSVDRYTAEYLNDPRKCAVIDSAVALPPNLRSKPCTVGIDEAGRGPVLGPMVYCAFAICIDDLEKLRESSVADSKTLSMRQREHIFRSMCELRESTFWCAQMISPSRISSAMLGRSKYNLNQLSQDSAAMLIRRLIDAGVNIKTVHVDTVGDSNKYRERLAAQFPASIEFNVCPKADSLFSEVSAASIYAKVLRDHCVGCWPLSGILAGALNGTEITEIKQGSGYPSDPDTQKFLRSVFEPVFGFPDFVRFSWSTAERMLLDNAVRVRWCDDANFSVRKSANSKSGAAQSAQQRKRLASPSEVGSLDKFLVPKESNKALSNQDSQTADSYLASKRLELISKYKREPDCFSFFGLRFSRPNRNRFLPVLPSPVIPCPSQSLPSLTKKAAPAGTQSNEIYLSDTTAQSCSSLRNKEVIGTGLRFPQTRLCDEDAPDDVKPLVGAISAFGSHQSPHERIAPFHDGNTALTKPSFSCTYKSTTMACRHTSCPETSSHGQAVSPQNANFGYNPFIERISNYPETDFDVKHDIFSVIARPSLDFKQSPVKLAHNDTCTTKQFSPTKQIKQEFSGDRYERGKTETLDQVNCDKKYKG